MDLVREHDRDTRERGDAQQQVVDALVRRELPRLRRLLGAAAGLAIILTACGIMLGAALYLVGSARRKARAALVQGLFPVVAVVAALIALLV